jgi:hypothetical protein
VKSTLLMMLAALAFPWNSFAQVPSLEEGANMEERPALWRRVLENHGSSYLVAYYASFHCPKGGPVDTYDALLYSGCHWIAPGESTLMNAGDPSRCSGNVNAAIFSDGHTEGDSQALDHLYSTRQGAYKALVESTQLLSSIQSEHESVQHVVDALTTRSKASLSEKTWIASGRSFVLSTVLDMLTETRSGRYRLPSDDPAHKEPAVEDVMKSTGLTREEARAIVIGKRLEGWKSLLEGNLRASQ